MASLGTWGRSQDASKLDALINHSIALSSWFAGTCLVMARNSDSNKYALNLLDGAPCGSRINAMRPLASLGVIGNPRLATQ